MGPLGPSGGMSSSRSILAGLGFTPLNKAGDTMLGDLKFTDGLYDIGKSGATRPRDIFSSRNIVATNSVTSGDNQVNLGGFYHFAAGTYIRGATDGVLTLTNNAGTDFTRLNLGGLTSSFPAWTRAATEIQATLADNSALTNVRALGFIVDVSGSFFISTRGKLTSVGDGQFLLTDNAGTGFTSLQFAKSGSNAQGIYTGANSPEGVYAANVGSLFLRQNGGASTTLYIKESGSGNTGWIAK